MIQTEEIITGDAILHGAGYVRVAWTTADSDDKGLRGNCSVAALQLGGQCV